MHIAIRTDASILIGSGHVMRCLTLADALRERGATCRFISREHPGNLLGLIRQRGHEATGLAYAEVEEPGAAVSDDRLAHSNWLAVDWQTDAEQTRAAIEESTIDWLVVDHYALDHRWESKLRDSCNRLMVIDDLADRRHECDLLLDQNLVANFERRYAGLVPDNCVLLLGTQYALLQRQYAELHSRIPPRKGSARKALVYFGGSDPANLTGMTVAAFLSLQRNDIALDVVVNADSPNAQSICRQVEGHSKVTVHSALDSLAPLMVAADVAIGASGATSWERCCLGLPSLVISLADNQRPIAAELNEKGLIRWLGHSGEVSEARLAESLAELFRIDLAEWSERCRQAVDGRGTERVCARLTPDAKSPLTVRPAELADEAQNKESVSR
jgi:UDP-2,4-diacetamido-2,4,6-trideoxy-beta-L-altropyranose hydrolase